MREFYFVLNVKDALRVDLDKLYEVKKALSLPSFGFMFIAPKVLNVDLKDVEGLGVPLALDNGAFSLLKVDFDSSVALDNDAKLRFCETLTKASMKARWEWVALCDLPVHGKSFVPKEERLKRVGLTVELHALGVELLEREGFPLKRATLVLQGYEVDEYVKCYEEMKGVLPMERLREVFAVGSVCVRKDGPFVFLASGKARGTYNDLATLLNYNFAPSKGLHFFGLHGKYVRALKEHPRFYSSDSGAWYAVLKYEYKDLARRARVKVKDYVERLTLSLIVQYMRTAHGKVDYEVLGSLF